MCAGGKRKKMKRVKEGHGWGEKRREMSGPGVSVWGLQFCEKTSQQSSGKAQAISENCHGHLRSFWHCLER